MKVGKRHVRHQWWELGCQWHLRSGMQLCVLGIGHLRSSSWRKRGRDREALKACICSKTMRNNWKFSWRSSMQLSPKRTPCSLGHCWGHLFQKSCSCSPLYFPFPAFPLRCQLSCSCTASLVSRLTQLSPHSHHVFPHHGTALAHCSLVLNYQAAPLSWTSGFQYLVCWDLLTKLMLLSTHSC